MIEQFHFLRPLWLLMIVPLAWLLWRYWHRQQRGGIWQSVCDPHLLPHLLMHQQGRTSRTPLLLLGSAGLLTILALAGPTWSKLPQPVYRNTAATVVLMNLSESMNAPDVTPSRLERAKLKLLDFLRRQREGQTALIAYTSEAYTVSPLTDDAATIESLVTALQTNIMPVQGNNLVAALNKADALLKQDGVYRGGRILLITDEAGGKAARKRAAALARKGRILSVLAVGTAQGAPITAPGGGFVQNKQGAILIPRLNRSALAKLAASGHGHMVGLTTTDADLDHLWPSAQASRINSQHPDRNLSADVWREQGPWLLLLVLPLVALAWRQGWLAVVVLAVMLQPHSASAATWKDWWARPDQQAYHALQHGDAKTAARLFKNLNWRSVAQYRAGNYAAAAAGFAHQHSPKALYNEANALAHLGKLEAAAQNYRKVLQQQPDNQDARHNLKIVEDLLKRRHPPQHSAQHKPGKGKSKNKGHGKSGQASGSKSSANQNGKQSKQNGAQGKGKQAQSRQAGTKQQHTAGQQAHKPAQMSSQANKASHKAQAGEQKSQARQQTVAKHRATKHTTKPNSANAAQQARAHRAGKSQSPPTSTIAQETPEQKESSQALQQWLRRIPDDPGGLLRRKFLYLHEQRERAAHNNGN